MFVLFDTPARAAPRAGRFLACGTAPLLQTSCSDPNKSANLSHLLTWADSSCTTATSPKYSPSVLEDLSQGGTHIFSFASGLSHLLSAYSSWEKYEILSKDLLISIQNQTCVYFCISALPHGTAQPAAVQSLLVCGARPLTKQA